MGIHLPLLIPAKPRWTDQIGATIYVECRAQFVISEFVSISCTRVIGYRRAAAGAIRWVRWTA